MTILSRLFGARDDRSALRPLYDGLVAAARRPFWYSEGAVPDTLEGRFDMLASLVALALLRLEREPGEAAKQASVHLTEIFIDDMDGTLRQIGIGDFVVGKHVGRLLASLGGRLGAFRDAFGGAASLEEAVRRNIYRDAPAGADEVGRVAARLRAYHEALGPLPMERMLAGELPAA